MVNLARSFAVEIGFLHGNLDAFFHRRWIVRSNLRPDAILQRRNDLPARGVVFRVRAEHQRDIQRQPDGISLNLHVAFLHDVEESNLNLARQIGQLVNRKNSAIGARQQPIMHRELAGQFMPAARRLDGIDIADQVRDGDIRRGQLLHVAMLGREPGNRRGVSFFSNQFAAAPADRHIRVIVDLATRDVRHLRIKQTGQRPQNSALSLAAQPEQNEIMPRQDRVHDLRHHRVVIAHDARKYRAALAQPRHQVLAQLIFDPPRSEPLCSKRTVAQLAKSPGNIHGTPPLGKALCGLYRRGAISYPASVRVGGEPGVPARPRCCRKHTGRARTPVAPQDV